MNSKYVDEIREVEARLEREREALVAQAEDLGATARDAAVSPKGLLAAVAVGFLLGELTAPRRRHEKAQAAATTAKVGIGGLVGSAIMAYARSRYGSPWSMGRSAWNYAADLRARRAEAAAEATTSATNARQARPAPSPVGASSSAARHAPTAPSPTSYSKPMPTPTSHAAG